MKKKLLLLFLSLVMILSLTSIMAAGETAPSTDIKGSLVIVGGALESSNADIYNKFIELAGGKEKAKVGVIGAASGSPIKYSKQFKDDLVKYGVPEANIQIIPIAMKNDKSTKDVDESTWAGNGDKQEVADMIKGCTGIWFVGGDQTRITETLYKADGSNTLSLNALWDIYKNGAVIGGTSAGAAIMSDPMIAGGNSLGALMEGFTNTYDDMAQQEYGPAYVTKGIGFFKGGIVDQHFDMKARLGRLVVVAYEKKNLSPFAYGVDENTAMVVYNQTNTIEAVGKGGVTIVDVTKAVRNSKSKKADLRDVVISYIERGDKYNYQTGEYDINSVKDLTNDYEYYDIPNPSVTGVFNAHSRVKDLITYDLVDNIGAKEVKSYCYDSKGEGFELVFRKTADTKGYWAYIDGIVDHYSAVKVSLDVKPITVKINYDNEKPAVEKVKEYVVKKGDNLWSIAKKLGVELKKLADINNMNSPYLIRTGQKLLLP